METKDIRLECIFPTSKYTLRHSIDKNSEIAKEERYKIINTRKLSSAHMYDGGIIYPVVEIVEVHCFNCLAKQYCQTENCTNMKGRCRICLSTQDICFECMEAESGYEKCCKVCAPCKTCCKVSSRYYSEPPYVYQPCPKRECSLCEEPVCNENIHKILDCQYADEPRIHELREYFIFLRNQILELKLKVLEVENVADRGVQCGEYAEREIDRLENRFSAYGYGASSSYY
jgi:hypothetical protein